VRADVQVSSQVVRSARVLQLAGMFDVPVDEKLTLSWAADLPVEDRPWNVGLITGPSGAGKSTIARHLWPGPASAAWSWSPDRALVDDFPAGMGIREVTGLLSAVGLASPPAWLRPAATLSNGERFRADMARMLAETPEGGLAVVDEFTSLVDRQVAQVASHAVQKAVRRSGRQLVGVTCHYDVEDWLQPDWTYDVAADVFAWRTVQPHPRIDVEIVPCDRAVWAMFRKHHYLSGSLHPGAKCFAGLVAGRPVAFVSHMNFPHPRVRNIRQSHRVVVLPDWQGLGIAGRMSEWLGEQLAAEGYRLRATTGHPARIAYYARSPRWRGQPGITKLSMARTGKADLRAKQLDPRRLSLRTFEYAPLRTGPATPPAGCS
jgi:alpha-D-ribose 1-methylphosphonate 5-triphosphate synthase subunit PhnL